MTQVQAQDPYAPPQAHVEDIQDPADSGALASRMTRLWAVLIDAAIGFAVYSVVSLVFFRTWWFQPDSPFGSGIWGATIISVLVGLVGFVAVQGWTLARRGQTLGKIAMRIRIVRQDGTPATGWRLIGIRYGVGYLVSMIPFAGGIYGLVDSLMIFRESRRCLHDLIAGTIVVHA